MSYTVEFTEASKKQLEKLDKYTQKMILLWIDRNVRGAPDPRQHGKALSANRAGQWRYRVGDYRIIVLIQDDRLVVLVITIGHRREVYDERG